MTQLAPTFNIYQSNVALKPKIDIISPLGVIAAAKKAVEICTNYTYEVLNQNTRQKEIVLARYMILVLVKRHTSLSLKEVGKIFEYVKWDRKTKTDKLGSFDHSGVLAAKQTIEDIEFLKKKDDRFLLWEDVKSTFKQLYKK